MFGKRRLCGLNYEYSKKDMSLRIEPRLLHDSMMPVVRHLLEFLKEKGANQYELIFYSSDPNGSVPVTQEMLKKAKSPAPNFIYPPCVSSFTSTGKTGDSYTAGTYKLEDKIDEPFWEWGKNHLYNFGVHELSIFNEENKKICEFWGEGEGINLYNITKTEAGKIKKQLKPFENNLDFWKDHTQYWRLHIELYEPKTEKERDEYRVYSSQQFLQDIIAGKCLPKDIGFDLKRFEKIRDYKFLVESIPNTPYKECWDPSEVLRLFKDLKNALKEKITEMPPYYQLIWLEGDPYSYTPIEIRDAGEYAFVIDGKEWVFRWGRKTVIARSVDGKIIDLAEGKGVFKIGEEYEAIDTNGNKMKFKVVKKNMLEMYGWLFEKIFKICDYAKENSYKVNLIIV